MATYTGSWSISGTTATYTINDGTSDVAKIIVSNLKDGVKAEDLAIDSPDYTEGGTITLKAAALGTDNVSMTATDASGNVIDNTYEFKLDDDVVTSSKAKLTGTWEVTPDTGSDPATATATYTGGKEAYYTASGTTVTCTTETPTTLATITGLKSDVTTAALAAVTDNSKTTGTRTGTITLTAGMFTESDVALTSDKYTFGNLTESEEDNFYTSAPAATYAWGTLTAMTEEAGSLKQAKYEKTVGKYYTLTNNKNIAYHDAVTTTDATLTNIASNFNDALPDRDTVDNTFTLTANMLNKDVANQTTLTLGGSPSFGYKLALADAVPKTNTVTNVNLWSVAKDATTTAADGTTDTYTATYATYKPEFFGLANNKLSVNYTGQTKADDLAIISGLVNMTATAAPTGTIPTGIAMPTSGTAITLAADLLHKPAVESKQEHTVAVTGTGGYTLAVADADAWAEKAKVGATEITDYWTVADADAGNSEPAGTKTAIYQYDTKAGYKADDDANATTLTYTQSKNVEVFRISGLKIAAPTASLTANPARYLDSDLDGITNPTADGKVIVLKQDALYTDSTKPVSAEDTPAAKLIINTAGGFEGYTLAYEPSSSTAYSYANKGANIKGDDIAEINLWTAEANKEDGGDVTYGSATLAAYKPEHFSVGDDKDTITYVPLALAEDEDGDTKVLAVISGLNITSTIELDEENNKFPVTEITGIATTFDSNALTKVTLDKRVLPEVADNTVTLDGDCELAIDTTTTNKVTEYAISNNLSWTTDQIDSDEDGTEDSTTATYQRAVTAGYTVGKQDDDDAKNNKITYTDATPIVVATIEGLKAGTNAVSGAIAGITVTAPTNAETPGTFELANSVLQGDTTLTLNEDGNHYTGADAYKGFYGLALNNDAQTAVSSVAVSKAGDVTGNISGYQLGKTDDDDESTIFDQIVSVATDGSVTLASISNLDESADPAISFNNGVITLDRANLKVFDDDDEDTTIKLTTTYDNAEVKAIVDTYTLKLKANATAKAYKDETATVSSVDEDGKATVTGKLDYYTLDTSDTGKSRTINYTADDTELATIDGLATGATAADVAISGYDDGVILLTASAVAGKNITLTNKQSSIKKYTLDWDSELQDSAAFRRTAEETDIWTADASKGTATYKKVTQDYYDLAADGAKVDYISQADVKTYFTLKGLTKDATVLKVSYNSDTDSDDIAGITLEDKEIKLAGTVLNNETVTFETGTGYTLAYEPEESDDLPNKATYTYDLTYDASKGTATFKQGNVAYYKLNGAKTQLTYNAAKDPTTTVVTVTGLSDEVVPVIATAAEINPAAATGAKWILGYSTEDNGHTADDILPAVTFLAPADEDDDVDEKVEINDEIALNKKDVTLTNGSGFSYELTVETENNIAPQDTSLWVKESSNYAYYGGKGAGYTLDEDTGLKLTYSKATKGTDDALAKITGLNSKVTINDDGKIVDSNGAEVVTVYSTDIALKKNALGTTDVKFVDNAGSYTFSLDTGADSAVPTTGDLTETWSEKNGTVTYTRATGAFYQLNPGDGTDDKATYLDESTYVRYVAPVTYNVTISGLESSEVSKVATKDGSGNITGYTGITVDSPATAEIKALTVGTGDDAKVVFDKVEATKGQVTVPESLFGKTKKGDIKVTSSNKAFGYTIDATALGSGSNIAPSADPTWEITNGKATYVRKVEAGKYYVDGSDKIAYYSSKKVLSTLATINGLSKDLTTFNPVVSTTATKYAYDDDGNEIEPEEEEDVKGSYYTITMNKNLLTGITKDKAKVTLTNGKDGTTAMEYRFVLDDDGDDKVDVPEVRDQEVKWVTKKGTATYQYETTAGFTVGDSKKTTKEDVITYSADKWTPIFTLSGLKRLDREYEVGGTGEVGDGEDTPLAPAGALDGIAVTPYNEDTKTWSVALTNKNNLTTSAIKIKSSDKNIKCNLDIQSDLKPTDYTNNWSYKSGTATLTNGTTAGYKQKLENDLANNDTINYVKATVTTTIATISGLPKAAKGAKEYYVVNEEDKEDSNLYVADANGAITKDPSTGAITNKIAATVSGVEIDKTLSKPTATAATITFTKDGLTPFNSGTIKVKEKYVTLAVNGDAQPTWAENNGTGAWSIEKGKATLNRTVAVAGWNTAGKANETAMSISYVPKEIKKGNTTTANVETLATITGLNKDLTLKTVATYNESTGTVTYAINGANDAPVLDNLNEDDYNTAIGKYIEFNPFVGDENIDGTTTLHNSVLTSSKVAIKSSNTARKYDLALADDVNDKSDKKENYWTVNGNKATFAYGKLAYYTPTADSKLKDSAGNKLITSINYTKAPTADVTYFTLSGIKKGAQAGTSESDQGDFYVSSGATVGKDSPKVTSGDIIVTLNKSAFDTTKLNSTKVAISVPKNVTTDALLAYGSDVTASDKAVTADSWTAGTGKATLERKVTQNGYMLSDDSKTVTYGDKDKTKATTLAILSGIKAIPSATQIGTEIQIGTNQVDGKKITLKDNVNGGYTLSKTAAAPVVTLADERSDSLKAASAWSTPKSGKVNLLGSVTTAGYTQSDNYNINYTAAATSGAKDKNLATVTGVRSSITAMTSTTSHNVASMNGDDLNNAVTVDGGGVISFEFESNFKGTAAKSNSITGSAKDDTITVAGVYIAINPGKGNDHIDLGSGKGNSVIYASGDGNDVISGFDSDDKIDITKGAFTVGKNGSDAVITVDKKNTITLDSYTGNVNIGGKMYNPSTGEIATSSDLLLDNNYSMNAATDELSSIIKADTGSYSPYKFNDSLKLNKEESFIPELTYTSNKK